MLDWAKIEAGKLELETVPSDLRSILDDVLSLFSEKSRNKGVEVSPDKINRKPGASFFSMFLYFSSSYRYRLIGDAYDQKEKNLMLELTWCLLFSLFLSLFRWVVVVMMFRMHYNNSNMV